MIGAVHSDESLLKNISQYIYMYICTYVFSKYVYIHVLISSENIAISIESCSRIFLEYTYSFRFSQKCIYICTYMYINVFSSSKNTAIYTNASRARGHNCRGACYPLLFFFFNFPLIFLYSVKTHLNTFEKFLRGARCKNTYFGSHICIYFSREITGMYNSASWTGGHDWYGVF